jgi:hypothetical protein
MPARHVSSPLPPQKTSPGITPPPPPQVRTTGIRDQPVAWHEGCRNEQCPCRDQAVPAWALPNNAFTNALFPSSQGRGGGGIKIVVARWATKPILCCNASPPRQTRACRKGSSGRRLCRAVLIHDVITGSFTSLKLTWDTVQLSNRL